MANGSSTDAITDGSSSSSSDSGVGSSSSSDSARAILWDPYSRILPVLFLIQLVCEVSAEQDKDRQCARMALE